jgi:long-chain fatty acid transport protein
MKNRFKLTLIASSMLLALGSQQASATNGYAAHGFGMTQKAMGGTGVASHDNAMNIATNPASMSFGDNNWTVGLDLFKPTRSSNHAGSPALPAAQDPFGQGSPAVPGADLDGNDDKLFPVPEFAYQRHVNDKFAVGLAVYGNGGMNATYDQSIFGPRTDQTGAPLKPDGSAFGANTGIDFSQLFIAPSASMKLNENHAIGASLNLVYQRITVNGVGGFAPFSRDAANLSDRDYDSSTGAGISLGWQGKLSSTVSAGLAYRSVTKMSKFDNYRGLLAEQGDFDIPSMITAGVSIQATPKTTFAIDVARINYTDVKSISNKNNTGSLQGQLIGQALGQIPRGTPLQGPLLGDDDGAGFGWKDQNVIKVGVKHQLNNKLTLMGGWNHGKAPIGEDQTAFNVLAPATVEDHLTLGLDVKLTNKSKLTVSYMHAFENEVKGNPAQTAQGPVSPGAFIPVGPHPIANASPANIKMYQDAIGIAYTKSF